MIWFLKLLFRSLWGSTMEFRMMTSDGIFTLHPEEKREKTRKGYHMSIIRCYKCRLVWKCLSDLLVYEFTFWPACSHVCSVSPDCMPTTWEHESNGSIYWKHLVEYNSVLESDNCRIRGLFCAHWQESHMNTRLNTCVIVSMLIVLCEKAQKILVGTDVRVKWWIYLAGFCFFFMCV